ncbi:MAG TPA: TolC family protein [Methylomirabilota bacterium]|nr:TolC family protein [Methylomirabilota bacterium]
MALTVGLAPGVTWSQPLPDSPRPEQLGLRAFVRRVLDHNESIQVRLLETEIARRKVLAEKGVFEPELVGGPEHVENERQNTAEQRRSTLEAFFAEKNNIYNGGIESLVPSGGRVRIGYTLRRLENSLQYTGFGTNRTRLPAEYQTFAGVSLTQPLLKNGGWNASMANIRLAAIASEVAFQEYRRQLMITVSASEAAYWNLFLAQEQLLFFRESVSLAETLLADNKARLAAGKGTELDVLEAEAGLALRQSKHSEAVQKYYEAVNRMLALYADSAISTNALLIAAEEPAPRDLPLSYFEAWQVAFDLNPDYLSQRKKAIAEDIRLAYARNQRWPQLDLKASYGLNGLGDSPGVSWSDVEHGDFPSWTVGLELRLPLAGGIKTRHELDAAKLRQKQSLLTLKEIETQIANALHTAIHKVISARDSVASYQAAVRFAQSVLDSGLERLKLGRVESRTVLEDEAKLLEAKVAAVEAEVTLQRAWLELELVQGAVLRNRQLELSQQELKEHTAPLVRRGEMTEADYQQFLREVRAAYDQKSSLTPAEERKALEILRRTYEEMDAPRSR